MNQKKTINIIRIALLASCILPLVLSYLFFINALPMEGFEMCGSMCEYWWSWIINFPPQGICPAVCVPRNQLYQPFFLIGVCVIPIEIVFEIYLLIRKSRKDST